jgi:hypothetical protein
MALEHRPIMTVEEYFLLEENVDPEEDFAVREENDTFPG